MNKYKYDIAISLCKEDVEYAESLIKELNPKMERFFYGHKQEELISELGPEKFGNVFKHDSRVVVILYTKEWGESYYTELERAAILDRTAKADQGQSFIMVIGMEEGAVPGWYPSSRIYANPLNFSTSQMASFIEYKVNERGGDVSPLTFEEQAELFHKKTEDRKELIRFLESPESLSPALEELDKVVGEINEKIDFVKKLDVDFIVASKPFYKNSVQTMQPDRSFIHLDKFRIDFGIDFFNIVNKKSSQNITLSIVNHEDVKGISSFTDRLDGFKKLNEFNYKFNSDKGLIGWSLMREVEDNEANRNGYLY